MNITGPDYVKDSATAFLRVNPRQSQFSTLSHPQWRGRWPRNICIQKDFLPFPFSAALRKLFSPSSLMLDGGSARDAVTQVDRLQFMGGDGIGAQGQVGHRQSGRPGLGLDSVQTGPQHVPKLGTVVGERVAGGDEGAVVKNL